MGNLCSNVRPRYKIYVIGVFDGKIDDLCTFAKLYPNQLPKIARYLLKQLNIRIQQHKSNIIHKDINLAMQAWNDLIFSCNPEIEKFESHILQSMILLFAEHSIQRHVLAMKTLRVYLPYSHKMSIDELLGFVDSCTSLADSDEIPIRTDALKTLSIIFTHLRNSAFCPDLYTKYERIIRAILLNMNSNNNDIENNKHKCDIYGEHCYEQFCSLISTNTLSIMLSAMSSILTEHYGWSPTKFVIKLFDILALKGSSIQTISIVQEILHILCNMNNNNEDNCDETFVEYIDRLNTMDCMIIALQEFSSRVISKSGGTKINRNPILSKLCSLLHIIEDTSAKKDSIDLSTERIFKFARNLLDCIQFYVIDISYIDSQSVILRMIKYLIESKSIIHTQLQLKCMLRTLAHRSGNIKSSKHTQDDIMKKLLKFHLKQQQLEDNDLTIELLQLSIQNLLLLSVNTNTTNELHQIEIGFDQTEWAIDRVYEFLESQIKYNNKLLHCNSSPTSSPTLSSSLTSSPTLSNSHSININQYNDTPDTVYELPWNQREWLYATIYSYLQNASAQFTENTILRITYTIIIVAISIHNFQSISYHDKIKKITFEVIDFELLIPFLISIQKLANKYYKEKNAIKESVICHSIILSVLLYIRNFLHCLYSKKSNYRYLFHKFGQIIDNIYTKCKQNNEIWSEFFINSSGLLTVSMYGFCDDMNAPIPITNIMPFDDIIESLSCYFDLIQARRLSNTSTRTDSWKINICKQFPTELILNHLLQETELETDLEVSLSGISQSILLTPSRYKHRYVNSTASFDMKLMHMMHMDDDMISNDFKSLQYMIIPLETLQNFQEITNTYSQHVDQLNKLQLSVTSYTDFIKNNNYYYSESSDIQTQTQTQTQTHTKSFTFDMDTLEMSRHLHNDNGEFFEPKQSIVESIKSHYESDLSHFYIEYENKQNPSQILHAGLCNRLDLMDLELENEMDYYMDVEYELNDVHYDDIQLLNDVYINNSHRMGDAIHNSNNNRMGDELNEFKESIQSPMRQLKAKGKSAVRQIRNRTRQLTQHMSVKTMQNFKNAPYAMREKTKQGSKVIKETFQNVKTKMFEQLKKDNKDIPHVHNSNHKDLYDINSDIRIEMIGIQEEKPPYLNVSKHMSILRKPHTDKNKYMRSRYNSAGNARSYLSYNNYNSEHDEISYTFSTAQTRSPTPPSKASINTI